MPRAQVMLLGQPSKRLEADAFAAGLRACGFTVHASIEQPRRDDVLVVWNRMGPNDAAAKRFAAAGAHVIVAENGYLGAQWRGSRWFALALGHHNGRGRWPAGGPERWDSWGVELAPMRPVQFFDDTERFNMIKGGVLLAQRGIGEPAMRAPSTWNAETARFFGFRIRRHPGNGGAAAVPLEQDLRDAAVVATWSSGAALRAMLMGVHVLYGMPGWIGASAATLVGQKLDQSDRRLAMFRRLAWAMCDESEAVSGAAFERLLQC